MKELTKSGRRGEVLLPENYLEVGLTEDSREVVINHPVDPQTVRFGAGHIVFSPDQARRLAKLLLRKADEAEKRSASDAKGEPPR